MLIILLSATLILSALTLLVAGLAYGRAKSRDSLDPRALATLLREESESLRRWIDDQARGQRSELSDQLRISSRDLADALREGLGQFGERLDQSVAQSGARTEDLRRLLDARLEAAGSAQEARGKHLRDELGAGLQRLGGAVGQTLTDLGERQKERLEILSRALESLTERQTASQETLRRSVEERLDAIRTENASKLEDMRRTVDEKLQTTLDTRIGEHFGRVVEHLNRVAEGLGEMKSLASNVGDLRNVLTNVKVRGTFGEVQLGLLLEQFLTPDQFVRDAKVREHTAERVEFAIKFPGRGGGETVLLPIDAKFPREDYDRLQEAVDQGDLIMAETQRKLLHTRIRLFAKEIRDKYVHPPETTDFAILFLPTESLYAEVLRQPGAFENIQRDFKVTLAGPTSLSAILNAFQMGFRTLAIEKRSSEVWQVLGAVQTEFAKYNQVVETLGKQLSSAATSVEKLGQRTRVMSRKLKTVEALPVDDASAVLGFEKSEALDELSEPEDGSPPSLIVHVGGRE